MKTIFATIIFIFISYFTFSQAIISPELLDKLNNAKNDNEYIEVNIFFNNEFSISDLSEHLDKTNADFDTRVKEVTSLLKNNSEFSFSEFSQTAKDYGIYDKIKDLKIFWGVNMINLHIPVSVIYKVSSFDFVRYIDTNSPRYKILDKDAPVILSEKRPGEAEIGLKTINAHLLWEMGYTGRNILFLSIDTGVFPEHPAIDDNFAGNHYPLSQCWYGVRNNTPVDNASSCHGTHTTGTVLGLDRETNDTIGVAYNSMWIATDPVASSKSELLTPSDFMSVFEWVLDPDGNPETTNDVPRVINNSWGYDYTMAAQFNACEMVEAEILINIETAGICSPFSAGNEGAEVETTGFPAQLAFNLVNPMSVGALKTNGEQIASFSSRGPTPCVEEEGSIKIKPEVSAPGVNVRSCIKRDQYGMLSGTSMACPHVSGALLLLAEAFPQASAYELKNSLYQTATDLGDVGEDNIYGNGLINVYAAYNYLKDTNSYTPVPPVTNQYDIKSEILSPETNIVCPENRNINANIKITNEGLETINQFNLKIYLNEQIAVDTLINESLSTTETYNFETETLQLEFGNNYIHSVVKPVVECAEYDMFNNADIVKYYVIEKDDFPFDTDFVGYENDLSDSKWFIQNPDGKETWQKGTWGEEEQHEALVMKYRNYLTRDGENDFANLPIIQLPDTDSLFFSFTFAFQKRLEFLYKDSLIIELSVDCGQTFPFELWRNGGEDMSTVEGNAGTGCFIPESTQDFDTIDIDISQFKNQEVLIRFRSVNDRGSIIYIDYVKLAKTQISNIYNPQINNSLEVFPNPTKNYITLRYDGKIDKNNKVDIYNSVGKLLKSIDLDSTEKQIPVDDLKPGIYFVKIRGTLLNSKIIVNK